MTFPQLSAVLVVVIAAIGDHPIQSPARPTALARDRADPIHAQHR
jgi:hypothetical protein